MQSKNEYTTELQPFRSSSSKGALKESKAAISETFLFTKFPYFPLPPHNLRYSTEFISCFAIQMK